MDQGVDVGCSGSSTRVLTPRCPLLQQPPALVPRGTQPALTETSSLSPKKGHVLPQKSSKCNGGEGGCASCSSSLKQEPPQFPVIGNFGKAEIR